MNARFWILISLGLLYTTTSAQDLGRRISFAAPAARACVLLPQLTKETGIDFLTVPQTANEVLLVQVHEVPIHDLLDRIAIAANAEWKKEGNAYRLVRPAKLTTKANAKSLELRTEAFKRFLSLEDADFKSAQPWSANQAQSLAQSLKTLLSDPDKRTRAPREFQKDRRAIQSQAPANTTIHRLLDQIGPRELASFDPSQRIVFALHPTSTQLALPGNAAEIITQFVESQGQYAGAYAQLGGEEMRGLFRDIGIPTRQPGDPALGVGQAILVLTPTNARVAVRGISFQADLTVADTAGATLASGSQSFFRQVLDSPIQREATKANPIELDPISKEFSAAVKSAPFSMSTDELSSMFFFLKGKEVLFHGISPVRQDRSLEPLSDILRAQLLQPEKFEPLSYVMGQALQKAANSLHLNLVADLPDSTLYQINQYFQERVDVSEPRTCCESTVMTSDWMPNWLPTGPSSLQPTSQMPQTPRLTASPLGSYSVSSTRRK